MSSSTVMIDSCFEHCSLRCPLIDFGESPTIAEEMAARDVLRTMFETTQHRTPLIFKEELELPERCFQENYRLPEYFDRYHSLSDSQTDEDRLLASS